MGRFPGIKGISPLDRRGLQPAEQSTACGLKARQAKRPLLHGNPLWGMGIASDFPQRAFLDLSAKLESLCIAPLIRVTKPIQENDTGKTRTAWKGLLGGVWKRPGMKVVYGDPFTV